MSMRQRQLAFALFIGLCQCMPPGHRAIASVHDAPGDTRAQSATEAAGQSAQQDNSSATATVAQELEGLYQKCGQDSLYLAIRNLASKDVTWGEIDELLAGAPTCTMEQLKLAAESMGLHARAAQLPGSAMWKLSRVAQADRPVSMILYNKPQHEFQVGHFSVLPWVAGKTCFYINPGYYASILALDNLSEDGGYLCLFVSDHPIELGPLHSSAFEVLTPSQALFVALGLGCVAAAWALRRRRSQSRRKLASAA